MGIQNHDTHLSRGTRYGRPALKHSPGVGGKAWCDVCGGEAALYLKLVWRPFPHEALYQQCGCGDVPMRPHVEQPIVETWAHDSRYIVAECEAEGCTRLHRRRKHKGSPHCRKCQVRISSAQYRAAHPKASTAYYRQRLIKRPQAA